jgi:hypothetical protein
MPGIDFHEKDADNTAGAASHERSPRAPRFRKGYRNPALEMRVGALDLKTSQFRSRASQLPKKNRSNRMISV